MNPALCPKCGTAAVAGRAFCAACGAPLTARADRPAAGGGAATGALPALPPAPASVDPFAVRSATKGAGAAKAAKAAGDRPTPPRATGPAPTGTGATDAPARRWWVPAAVSVAVVVALAVGATLVLAGRGDDGAAPTGVTTGAGADPPSPATTGTGSAPITLSYRHHVARHYEVEVPDAWQTTYEDRVVSRDPESLVTRWEDPFRAMLAITTSSPITGTVSDDCTAIFADRVRSSVLVSPVDAEVPGRETCTFAYVRPDGQVRVEHLFAVGEREFLVTAGAGTQDLAGEIADAAAGTLEPR